MTLQAAVSGMSIEFIDGRNGHDIPDKALPNGVDRTKFPPNPLGCWRGHMDAVQRYTFHTSPLPSLSPYARSSSPSVSDTLGPNRIVRENISTALIMEDDADWDVRLKPSLTDFARGARYIQSIPPNASLFSPYGDDWDVLWIGHCGETFPENDDRVFVIPDDPSVPSPRHIGYPLLAERYANHTRVVHRANGPICLYGYALSQRGAQRMLWGLSVKQLRGFVDNELAGFCSGNTGLDVTCVSSQPTYIRTHRAAGSMTKDSDNVGPEALSKEVRETGETVDVRWSVRMNMEKLLKGETEGFEDQFPD